MTRTEAVTKIRDSLSKGAQVITPKGQAYEVHVEKLTKSLFEHIVDPVKATVVSACFPQYDFAKYKVSKVWAIAHRNTSWLLTIEGENEFALGFGEDAENIMMHGFSSSDALAEWCA